MTTNKRAEEKILETIKEMTTEDGKKVKEVATKPITRKEQEEAYLKEHPPTQPVDDKVDKSPSRELRNNYKIWGWM